MLGDVKDFLFFDVEVFSHNSLVVFKNVEGKTIRVFSSSLDPGSPGSVLLLRTLPYSIWLRPYQ